jgi:hypothetical protein
MLPNTRHQGKATNPSYVPAHAVRQLNRHPEPEAIEADDIHKLALVNGRQVLVAYAHEQTKRILRQGG